MTDKQCEEIAFPVQFSKGKFGYTAERDAKLSPVKYFNAKLLHYSGWAVCYKSRVPFLCTVYYWVEKVSDSISFLMAKTWDL